MQQSAKKWGELYDNYRSQLVNPGHRRGRHREQKNTTTNRIDSDRQYRTNAASGGRRGASVAIQQSTEVEIMLFFIVFTCVYNLHLNI